MIARIWASAPDPGDGTYVEIIDPHKGVVDENWRPDTTECIAWALAHGAKFIEIL